MALHAQEVMAVAMEVRSAMASIRHPILIGHSFGGWIVLSCARTFGESLAGCVTIDAAVVDKATFQSFPPPSSSQLDKKRGDAAGCERERAAIEGRFRLLPPQDCSNQWLLDYVARHSVRENPSGHGWEFKIDPERFARTNIHRTMGADDGGTSGMQEKYGDRELMWNQLQGLRCRLAVVYGDRSMMFSDGGTGVDFMRKELASHSPLAGLVPFLPIVDSAHHVMFDQPLALVATLTALIGEWERADASSRPSLLALGMELPAPQQQKAAAQEGGNQQQQQRRHVDFAQLKLPSNTDLKNASKL